MDESSCLSFLLFFCVCCLIVLWLLVAGGGLCPPGSWLEHVLDEAWFRTRPLEVRLLFAAPLSLGWGAGMWFGGGGGVWGLGCKVHGLGLIVQTWLDTSAALCNPQRVPGTSITLGCFVGRVVVDRIPTLPHITCERPATQTGKFTQSPTSF